MSVRMILSLNPRGASISRYGWCGVHSCTGVGARSCGAIVGYGLASVHGDRASSLTSDEGSMARMLAF